MSSVKTNAWTPRTIRSRISPELGQKAVFKRGIEFFEIAAGQAVIPGIDEHLPPYRLIHAFVRFFDKIALSVQNGVAKIIDLNPPGDHLQGSGHIGLGGAGLFGNLAEPVRAVARGAVLGSGYLIGGQLVMDFAVNGTSMPASLCSMP